MATNLDCLNALLKANQSKLNIPQHVSEVYSNGKNQQWLRKNLAKNKNTPAELMDYLNMTTHQLAQTAPVKK